MKKFNAGDGIGCLVVLIPLSLWAGFWGVVIYVAWHFISKYW